MEGEKDLLEACANDPQAVLRFCQELQLKVQRLEIAAAATAADSPVDGISSTTPAPTPSPTSIDPQVLQQVLLALATKSQPTLRSEKLPDIPEYEGEESKLDDWDQALVQRMHINHDRYPTDQMKIAYAESRLTIGKRAHLLMGYYRTNGLCTINDFSDWRHKLREACGNPFEREDARKYLRETLKQGTMLFEEYLFLFMQKKERSQMEDASLIDCLKANVNYATQAAAINYRLPDTNREPRTFREHVQMLSDTALQVQKLKHTLPRTSSTPASSSSASAPKKNNNTSGNNKPTLPPVLPVLPVAPTPASLPSGDPMDLSSAVAAVKGKSLRVPGVRKICDIWQLCYYCKLFHPGKTAINCPNKEKKSDADARAMVLYEKPIPDISDDTENI